MMHSHEPKPNTDTRDAISVGILFIAFGIVSWFASGGNWRKLLPQRTIPDAFRRAFDGATDALAWGSPDDHARASQVTDALETDWWKPRD